MLSQFISIFSFSRTPKSEECSLSAEDTCSPHSQGPPTPPTTPNRGPRAQPGGPSLPLSLSCSQASGKLFQSPTHLLTWRLSHLISTLSVIRVIKNISSSTTQTSQTVSTTWLCSTTLLIYHYTLCKTDISFILLS